MLRLLFELFLIFIWVALFIFNAVTLLISDCVVTTINPIVLIFLCIAVFILPFIAFYLSWKFTRWSQNIYITTSVVSLFFASLFIIVLVLLNLFDDLTCIENYIFGVVWNLACFVFILCSSTYLIVNHVHNQQTNQV